LTKPQWAPRLGFSWDVHGDSTLKLFGNAGRYYLALPTQVALSIASPVKNYGVYYTYTGIDPATGEPTGLTPLPRAPKDELAHVLVAEIARRQFEPDSARELCEIAKIDHILFKKRVFDTLLGGEQAKAADLGDHHGCRLGKWVGTMNDPAITGHPAFAALQGPHARVHAAAKAALTAHAAGRVAAAIEEAETMDAASDEVVRRLTELGDALAAKAASEAA